MKCSNTDKGLQYNVLTDLEGIYSMDIYQAEALKIVKNHDADKPLFLYLAVQTPHSPYYSPIKYMTKGCISDRCVMQGNHHFLISIISLVMSQYPRDKGQGTRDKGQGTRDKGQGTRDKGQGTRDKGQGTRDKGQGTRDKGQGTREKRAS